MTEKIRIYQAQQMKLISLRQIMGIALCLPELLTNFLCLLNFWEQKQLLNLLQPYQRIIMASSFFFLQGHCHGLEKMSYEAKMPHLNLSILLMRTWFEFSVTVVLWVNSLVLIEITASVAPKALNIRNIFKTAAIDCLDLLFKGGIFYLFIYQLNPLWHILLITYCSFKQGDRL